MSTPQKSNPEIPSQMAPFISQGQGYINNVANGLPNYNNFLNSASGQNIQGLSAASVAPGGAAQNQSNLYNQFLTGQFLNPASNPFLAAMLNQSGQQFQQTTGRGMDQLAAMFNMSGQGTNSGAFGNAASQYMRGATQDQGNSVNSMLYGNYNQGIGQMFQAMMGGDPALSTLGGAMPFADLGNTMAMQQTQANAIPAQLMNQFMQSIPMGYPQYGPSPLQQYFQMAMQGIDAGAKMYAAA